MKVLEGTSALLLLLIATGTIAKPPKGLNRLRAKGGGASGSSVVTQGGSNTNVHHSHYDQNATDWDASYVDADEEGDDEATTDDDELTEILNTGLDEFEEEEDSSSLPSFSSSSSSSATGSSSPSPLRPPPTKPPTTTTKEEEETTHRHAADMPVDEGGRMSETAIIAKIKEGYDARVRPAGYNATTNSFGAGPVQVTINMLIRSISKIDNVNMEYSVQMTFREEWIDPRLKFDGPGYPDFVIMDNDMQIWMPDSFFQNEKQAHRHVIDKPNVLIRVYKTGAILYSVRLSLVLSCPMHLQNYPMDVQTCLIDIASYAYTDADIMYEWKTEKPVQQKEGLNSSLPSFHLESMNTTYCTSITSTGTYSCLRAQIKLKRQFSYYLLQLYVPSSMLVVVSWVSFWLDRSAVPARVTLGVTTLLTMTTQSSGISAKLPPVAYIKAIDVWIGACLTFIFGALLEFALVTFLATRNERRKKKSVANGGAESRTPEVWIPRSAMERADLSEEGKKKRTKRSDNCCCLTRWWRRHTASKDTSLQADFISRIAFPTLFITFNIAYWSRYQYPES